MKGLLKAVLLRLGIGLCVSVIAIIASLVTSKWYIADRWLGLFGMIVIALGALPFVGGSGAATQTAWLRPQSYMEQFKESHGFASSWTATAFLIGLPNLIVAIIVYRLVAM